MTFHDSAIQQLNGLTSPFALICRALERRLCFTATAADWLRWLAEAAGDRPIDNASEGFQLLHRALLQREESRTATHVFCPACYCHHEIFISHASITASCRCNDDPDCPD